MKTKALILGAKPLPFEGTWVPIGEAGKWRALVRTEPLGVDVLGKMRLEVRLAEGSISMPLVDGLEISGDRARVIIGEAFTSCRNVSVTLEAV